MSTEHATEREAPPRNVLVERSPIIIGAVGAVIALGTLIGWPWEVALVARLAIAWLSLALAVLAISAIARGRQNARAIIAIVVGVAAFAFWLVAPELLGALPVYAYVLTAVVHIGLGLLIGRLDADRGRGVYIATAGAVVFTVLGAITKLGGG